MLRRTSSPAIPWNIGLILAASLGCGGVVQESQETPARPSRHVLAPKMTQDIDEFQGDREVVVPDVEISNPYTGALEAYEPIKQQLAQLNIEHSVELFHALEGRYPKDHEEFMQRVIRENNIRLPEPGKGFEYQYDVDRHELVIVKSKPDDDGS